MQLDRWWLDHMKFLPDHEEPIDSIRNSSNSDTSTDSNTVGSNQQ